MTLVNHCILFRIYILHRLNLLFCHRHTLIIVNAHIIYLQMVPNPRATNWHWSMSRLVPGRER